MSFSLHQLRTRIRRLLRLADAAETPVHFSKFIPSPRSPDGCSLYYRPTDADTPLPIPPKDLWLGYGHDEESYVSSGLADIKRMTEILRPLGFDLDAPTQPVLDLGCGGGRMIRHLRAVAKNIDVWGLDISAPHINWLKTRLSPPFRFAVNTTLPHLPFPDASFGLVYCGSVFTHIDDLAESWFLEVHRILAPGGFLYCTLHDEHSRDHLIANPDHPLARSLKNHPYLDPRSAPADIMITGQTSDSNVYYHSRYLTAMLSPMFEIAAVIPEASGCQTAWVLRRRPRP